MGAKQVIDDHDSQNTYLDTPPFRKHNSTDDLEKPSAGRKGRSHTAS